MAGIGAPRDGAAPAWVTHVRVDSAGAAAERARAAGGAVLDGPIDADPAGRFAVLADPLGAVFCAWEADIREGAELINEPGAWAMSALQTPDPERAAAFYGELFGWQAEPWGPVHLLRLPGYVGGTEEQPVPRDVVAVMAPLGDPGRPRAGPSTSGSRTTSRPSPPAPPSSAAASSCRCTTGRRSAAPSSPTRRARRSRSAGSRPERAHSPCSVASRLRAPPRSRCSHR